MKLHANAALTVHQRTEVRRLHSQEGVSIRELARRFSVNPTTIQRWIKRSNPLDHTTAPVQPHSITTPEYRRAVIDYRRTHPHHGPIRIAAELQRPFAFANRGTALKILQEEALSRPKPLAPRQHKPIPVGRHRVQMDIQQLPAIRGQKGFEYKISVIHLRTRLKYSEIHGRCTSDLMAAVLRRALDRLPPFFSSGPTTPLSSP